MGRQSLGGSNRRSDADTVLTECNLDSTVELALLENFSFRSASLARELLLGSEESRDKRAGIAANIVAASGEGIRRVLCLSEDPPVNALWNIGIFALLDGFYLVNRAQSGVELSLLDRLVWPALGVAACGTIGWFVAGLEQFWPFESERERIEKSKEKIEKEQIRSAINQILEIRLSENQSEREGEIQGILDGFVGESRKLISYVVQKKLERVVKGTLTF